MKSLFIFSLLITSLGYANTQEEIYEFMSSNSQSMEYYESAASGNGTTAEVAAQAELEKFCQLPGSQCQDRQYRQRVAIALSRLVLKREQKSLQNVASFLDQVRILALQCKPEIAPIFDRSNIGHMACRKRISCQGETGARLQRAFQNYVGAVEPGVLINVPATLEGVTISSLREAFRVPRFSAFAASSGSANSISGSSSRIHHSLMVVRSFNCSNNICNVEFGNSAHPGVTQECPTSQEDIARSLNGGNADQSHINDSSERKDPSGSVNSTTGPASTTIRPE